MLVVVLLSDNIAKVLCCWPWFGSDIHIIWKGMREAVIFQFCCCYFLWEAGAWGLPYLDHWVQEWVTGLITQSLALARGRYFSKAENGSHYKQGKQSIAALLKERAVRPPGWTGRVAFCRSCWFLAANLSFWLNGPQGRLYTEETESGIMELDLVSMSFLGSKDLLCKC